MARWYMQEERTLSRRWWPARLSIGTALLHSVRLTLRPEGGVCLWSGIEDMDQGRGRSGRSLLSRTEPV